MEETSTAIRTHLPCDACGSSDALAVYTNGTYCFSCKTYTKAEGDSEVEAKEEKKNIEFISGKYQALTKRGITEETCRKFGYKVGTWSGHPCHVASYYKNGMEIAQHIRTPDKQFPWTGDPSKIELFGQHLWQPQGENPRLIITEGEIDAMSISQVFNNKWAVVSVPNGASSVGKYLRQNLEFIESFDDIVLAFDNDSAGVEAVDEAVSIISCGKIRVLSYPDGYKDPNDLLANGKGGQLVANIFQARPYRPDGILNGTELWSYVSKPTEDGISLPYPELSHMLRGLQKGVYMFTAGSGAGKSTFVHEIGYHITQEHEEKLGVVALEDSTQKTALRYPSLYLNKRLELESVDPELLRDAYEKTINNERFYLYDHFGSLDSDNLMSKIRFMIVSLGCKYIILDHLSIVISGMPIGDERKAIDRLMTDLRSLAEETGACLLCVVHINRAGNNANEGGQISLRDLRGSGSLEQLSDAVIAIERDQQCAETGHIAKVRVLKNRTTGEVGIADVLTFNKDTGRLLPSWQDDFAKLGLNGKDTDEDSI
tara:strand:- start:1597 stop:3222 length:1626 start_codon:yes stop_codon:yes gene_type:complete